MFNSYQFNRSGFNGLGTAPAPTGAAASKINYALSVAIAGSDGTRLKRTFTETGRRSIDLTRNLFGGSTNVLIPAAWPIASTQAIYLLATGDVTIRTNNPTAPADVITLKAGLPLLWNRSTPTYPNPFTADVTALYCTCTAAAFLQGAILTT